MGNINWQPSTLQNNLVKLVPLTETDFDRLYTVASDPEIWEQHPEPERYLKSVFRLFFKSAVESKTAFLIIDQATQSIIGSTRFYLYKPEESSIAIGYTFLAKRYWGKQYNRACKELLLGFAFEWVDNVYFYIGAQNIRSQLAIARLGAIKTRDIITERKGQPSLDFEYVLERHKCKQGPT
jgi:RimJ/RimL family protein N-acetyltransferase